MCVCIWELKSSGTYEWKEVKDATSSFLDGKDDYGNEKVGILMKDK